MGSVKFYLKKKGVPTHTTSRKRERQHVEVPFFDSVFIHRDTNKKWEVEIVLAGTSWSNLMYIVIVVIHVLVIDNFLFILNSIYPNLVHIK